MRTRVIDRSLVPGNIDSRLKIGWAKHHLRALDAEIARFREGEAYTISTKDDFESGEYVVRLDVGLHLVNIELIAGDFVACLRSSLDYLAYALTLIPGGTPNDKSSFPILDVMNSNRRGQFERAVRGIPGPAVAVIESLQPYHDGDAYNATKLWRLQRLWNIDKHRRIPFHQTVAKMNLVFPHGMYPVMSGTEEGSEARFPLAAKGKVYLKPPIQVSIEFGDAAEGVIVPYEEFIDIHEFVRDDVMPRFQGFF